MLALDHRPPFKNLKYRPELSLTRQRDVHITVGSLTMIVKGKTPRSGSKEAAAEEKRIKAPKTLEVTAQQAYNQASEAIYGIILASIGNGPYRKIKNAEVLEGDGPSAYSTLRMEYLDSAGIHLPQLLGQLVSIAQTSKLDEYTYKFKNLVARLNDQLPELPDQLLASIYLNGLQAEHDDIKSMIYDTAAQSAQSFTLENAIKRVKHNASHSRPQARGAAAAGNSPRPPPRCRNCGSRHHKERWCRLPCKTCKSKDMVTWRRKTTCYPC